MPVYSMQVPNKVSSMWTVDKMVKTLRSVLDEPDNGKLSDEEIRYFMNVCTSGVVYAGAAGIDTGYYGTMCYGVLDKNQHPLLGFNSPYIPYLTISLSEPVDMYIGNVPEGSLDIPSRVLNESYYTPDMVDPVNMMEQDNELSVSEYVTEGAHNIFNKSIAKYKPDPLNAPQREYKDWYSSYIIPSAIIDDIVDVTIANRAIYELTATTDRVTKLRRDFLMPLTKVSISEINQLRTQANVFSHSGAWSYLGGKIHIYLGEELWREGVVTIIPPGGGTGSGETAPVPHEVDDDFHFQISALRKPILDNLYDTWDERSSWFKKVDVPDKYIRTLLLATQKMCMDKLGKRIGYEMEAMLNQLLGGLSNTQSNNSQLQQLDRIKQEQGFQTR